MTNPDSLLPELAKARSDIAVLHNRLAAVEGQRNESMNREVVLVADNAMMANRIKQLEAIVAELGAPKGEIEKAPEAPRRGRRRLGVQKG